MAYCKKCKQECEVVWEDVGIGSYEFWGSHGVHTEYACYSKCCEDELFDDEECTIPFSGSPDDNDDCDYPEDD